MVLLSIPNLFAASQMEGCCSITFPEDRSSRFTFVAFGPDVKRLDESLGGLTRLVGDPAPSGFLSPSCNPCLAGVRHPVCAKCVIESLGLRRWHREHARRVFGGSTRIALTSLEAADPNIKSCMRRMAETSQGAV